MMNVTARVKIHQVDEYVWCDGHGEIHDRKPNVYDEDETGSAMRCNADAWRPVFTTDNESGSL
jgi:hypothetical protein